MKPTNDLFVQQVRELYEGHEVPAPVSTKDAVFKELDASSAPASGSLASKSLLIAASLVTVGAVYMLTNNSSPVQDTPVVIEEVIEEVVETPVVIEEPIVEVEVITPDPVVETPVHIEEVVETPTVVVETPVHIEEVVETPTVVVETPAVVVEAPVVVVEAPVVIEEIKEVAPPFEVIETTPVEEEKMEEVEWVLPATIKVEK